MTRWLNGNAPLADARTSDETSVLLASVPKDQRANLTQSEKLKLKKLAEQGLESKFSLVPILDDDATKEQLEAVYNVSMRIVEFKKSLRLTDMTDVFSIPDSFEENPDPNVEEEWPAGAAESVDILNEPTSVTLEVTKKMSIFLARRGQGYHAENLLWSGTKLLNSCDKTLREKIEEKTIGYPVECQTGPVHFKIMIDLILSSSDQSMRSLATRLETAKMSDYPGENVITASSFIRTAALMLSNNDSLPKDVIELAMKIFKTASTKDFRDEIVQMWNNHKQGVKTITLEEMLTAAETSYLALKSTPGGWEAAEPEPQPDVAFYNQGGCFNCGSLDHLVRDCDKPKDEQTIQAAIAKSRSGRGYGGRGYGAGRGHRGGRGGRGRGGRGGGRGDQGFNPRKPPGKGESHEKFVNGRKKYWNGRNGVWEDSPPQGDPTSEHANVANSDDKDQQQESEEKKSVSFAGLASDF